MATVSDPNTIFSVPIFFILFRESTEAAVVVSVLLSFINSCVSNVELRKKYHKRVWFGTFLGLALSLGVGVVFLVIWYKYATDLWVQTEALWEGVFGLVGCVLVAVTALAMLKANKLIEKYEKKFRGVIVHPVPEAVSLTDDKKSPIDDKRFFDDHSSGSSSGLHRQPSRDTLAQENRDTLLQETPIVVVEIASPLSGSPVKTRIEMSNVSSENEFNAMPHGSEECLDDDTDNVLDSCQTGDKLDSVKRAFFWLPFITVLREGLESVVFMGGLAINEPPTSIPLAACVGILAGFGVGLFMHKGGSKLTLHWFFVASSFILLLIAGGLLAKSITLLESYAWSKAIRAEADDAGFFYPWTNVWHLKCCNPEDPNSGGWGIFNGLLGWTNNASSVSISLYCVFWLTVCLGLVVQKRREAWKKSQ